MTVLGKAGKEKNCCISKGLEKPSDISSASQQIRTRQREYRDGRTCCAQKPHEKETMALITLAIRSTVQQSTMKCRSLCQLLFDVNCNLVHPYASCVRHS